MNKLVKGSLAGAAGVVLLLGGAGTFAYWNSQAGVTGGTVSAGRLALVNDGAAGVWTDQNDVVIDPATYRIVPGDVLTYTDDLTLTAVGDNLQAELTLAGGAIAPTSGSAADAALVSFLSAQAVLDAVGTNITSVSPNVFAVTEGTAAVTTTVTLTFPFGTDTTNNSAQLGSVNLSNMAISLVQTQ